ncbi:MAG: protein kinase, partial [Holophagales bacterium]|nr:protein kinase [Holophagales bacterium]
MNPQDVTRARQIFEAVVDAPEVERAEVLQQLCSDHPELHSEVAHLLSIDGETRGDQAPSHLLSLERADALAAEASLFEPPRELGPYRIEGLIGEGGMGAVYRARRTDGLFDREVAVKVMRWTAVGEEAERRFHHELEILARLEHPSIARLYDSGLTGDGRPFLIMELVEGEPVTEYCDRLRLGVSDRLALFRRICEGVQFAHQRMVIH